MEKLKNCPTITFDTKCWEEDWEIILCTDYLKRQIENCDYPFTVRRLFINNVDNPSLVKSYAEKAVKNGIIDEYFFVEEHAKEALEFFEIEKESFGGGIIIQFLN